MDETLPPGQAASGQEPPQKGKPGEPSGCQQAPRQTSSGPQELRKPECKLPTTSFDRQ